MSDVLNAKGLVKEFSRHGFKLGPIDLRMSPGDALALIGHNGAGKSTLFKLITGNLDATTGEVKVLGRRMDPRQFGLKRQIGYLPQDLGLPAWLTPFELLDYARALYGVERSRVEEALEVWDCSSFAYKPIKSCSHGMQKRVGLGLAFLHRPRLILLDEPFSGLDFQHMKTLQNKFQEMVKDQAAIILCTHIAPYAAKLCNQGVLLSKGHLTPFADWPTADAAMRVTMMEDGFEESR